MAERDQWGAANPNWKGGPAYRACDRCGAKYAPERRAKRSRFCSRSCRSAWESARTPAERLWANVDRDGPMHPVLGTKCWVWTSPHRARFGYGKAFVSRGTTRPAHRLSWELSGRVIPVGECVLHRCDNPPCVNPAHLFTGTKADNVRDMDAKGRRATGDRNGARVHPERVSRGDAHATKLTSARVVEMRARRTAGARYADLAIEFGVSESMVWQVVTGRKWREVALFGPVTP